MALLADLAAVCGEDRVRPGGVADVGAEAVVTPSDSGQVGAVIQVAARHHLAVTPVGGATKLGWGPPLSAVDILLDTELLSGRLSHDAGRGIATFGGGTPVRAAAQLLAGSNDRLALDPPSEQAGGTIGGVLATGETGPLRLLTGPLSDLVVDIEYVAGDGQVRHLAGLDVAVLCGSLGTLGVITAVTVRLAPRPPATAWVRRSVHSPSELSELVLLLDTTPLNVAAVEADLPALDPVLTRVPRQRLSGDAPGSPELDPRPGGPGTFAVQIEGTSAAVADRVTTAVTLLGGDALWSSEPPSWWGRYPTAPDQVLLRLTLPRNAVEAIGYVLRDATGAAATLRGAVSAGVVLVGLPAELPVDRVVGVVEAVRHTLLARGGTCVVLRAPAEVHEGVRASDRRAGLAGRLKERYDPDGRFSPGRLPLGDDA